MKNVVSIIVLLGMTLTTFGQNFQPFATNNPKRFSESGNSASDDYFFYPISTTISGDSIIYKQYFRLSSFYGYADPNICPNWGSDYGELGDTTFLGRQFVYNSNLNILHLMNVSGESVDFDLGVLPGDSVLIYQSSSDAYYLQFNYQQEELVISVTDSVRHYSILHYDSIGQMVNSSLNNFEIRIGKELGMITFIDCNNFPVSETGLELIGQLNPMIGDYQLTYDEMYPWQPGDIVEYRGTASLGGFGTPYTINYRLLSVTNRIETTDSVYIFYDQFIRTDSVSYGYPGPMPVFNITHPNPLAYKKGTLLSVSPFGSMPYYGVYSSVISNVNCSPYTVYFDQEFTYYCDSCECMLPYDGNGSDAGHSGYEKDRGLTYLWIQHYGTFSGNSAEMIYSKIAGVECGTIEYVGMDEQLLECRLSPNPALGSVHIKAKVNFTRIEIIGPGSQVISVEDTEPTKEWTLDLSPLQKGVYFFRIRFENGTVSTEKLTRL